MREQFCTVAVAFRYEKSCTSVHDGAALAREHIVARTVMKARA
jgi:hypothetical protein